MALTSNHSTGVVSVSAPAKLLLFGEYLALHGHPAIGIPIPLYTKAKFIPNTIENTRIANPIDTNAITIRTTKNGIDKPGNAYAQAMCPLHITSNIAIDEEFYTHMVLVCKNHNIRIPKGHIQIQSTIPLASGFGSSASFCVCIAKILLCGSSIENSTDNFTDNSLGFAEDNKMLSKIWRLAHNLEHYFHGTASGIDTAIITYNTALLLEPTILQGNNTPALSSSIGKTPCFIPKPLACNFMDHLIFGYTPRDHTSTSPATTITVFSAQIAQYMADNNSCVTTWIQAHSQAINSIKDCNTKKEDIENYLALLAQCCTTIHTQLDALQMSNTVINTVLQKYSAEHALGGKMSGSGLGGAFFLLCKDTYSRNKLRDTMQSHCLRYNAIIY